MLRVLLLAAIAYFALGVVALLLLAVVNLAIRAGVLAGPGGDAAAEVEPDDHLDEPPSATLTA